MACCCKPPQACPQCDYTCQVNGANYPNKTFQLYYGRGLFHIENLPCCPVFLGYSGSYKTQDLWKCCAPINSVNVPPLQVPAFTWNEDYPENLVDCLTYWVLDIAAAQGFGENCCSFDEIDPVTGERRCGSRNQSGLIGTKGKYRWRLLLLDCAQRSFTDITDDAITKIGIFEGTWNTFEFPLNRDCDSTTFTALPDYFDDPEAVCDG